MYLFQRIQGTRLQGRRRDRASVPKLFAELVATEHDGQPRLRRQSSSPRPARASPCQPRTQLPPAGRGRSTHVFCSGNADESKMTPRTSDGSHEGTRYPNPTRGRQRSA